MYLNIFILLNNFYSTSQVMRMRLEGKLGKIFPQYSLQLAAIAKYMWPLKEHGTRQNPKICISSIEKMVQSILTHKIHFKAEIDLIFMIINFLVRPLFCGETLVLYIFAHENLQKQDTLARLLKFSVLPKKSLVFHIQLKTHITFSMLLVLATNLWQNLFSEV